MGKRTVGFDLECSSKDPLTCEIASIQIYEQGQARVIPINLQGSAKCDPVPVLREIAEKYRVIGHYLTYDLIVAQRHGVIIEPAADTYLLFCQTPDALNYSRDKRGLKDLVQYYGLDQDPLRFEDVCPTGDFRDVSVADQEAMIYAGRDPQYAFELARLILGRYGYLEQAHLKEMEVLNTFCAMTLRGMRMSAEGMADLKNNLASELAQARLELIKQVGVDFKPNSAKDIIEKEVFERLSLQPPEVTGGKKYPSITKEVLQRYLPNPHIRGLLRVRKLMYALPRVENVLLNHVRDGRLHPVYTQVGHTGSARVYSQSPSTSSLSSTARGCVVASPNKRFVYMDWSGAEFALAVQEAGEQAVVRAYRDGAHPIVAAAAEYYRVPPSQVAEKQKEVMKTVIYAVMYGSAGYSVAQALGISLEQAEEYTGEFWRRFGRLQSFRDDVVETAKIRGTVTTLTGFVRHLRDPEGRVAEGDLERRAFNTRCQSGVAGLFKIAARKLEAKFPPGCSIITGVFDSMLLEVPVEIELAVIKKMLAEVSTFTGADGITPGLEVMFQMKVGEGETWAQAQRRAV